MSAKSVQLTEKQKNHSLSAKKKKSKKSVRYTLAQPFPRYWYVSNVHRDDRLKPANFIETLFQATIGRTTIKLFTSIAKKCAAKESRLVHRKTAKRKVKTFF